MIGIIGGSGLYNLIEDPEEVKIHTPYGNPSTDIEVGEINGVKVAFIARHGKRHSLPPHRVPYRANIYALKKLGIRRLITVSAVGSLKEEYRPGELVTPHQFIDFTKNRRYTFYEGPKVAHIPMADPFCPDLRKNIIDASKELSIKLHDTGVYTCIEGPRFSTRAESHMFRNLGGDIIGMTLVPEVNLAREAGMCFANISMITDYDVWANKPVDVKEVMRTFRENVEKVNKIIPEIIKRVDDNKKCLCQTYIEESFV